MPGHLVGWDPATRRVVILRRGADGKAVRQVDVLDRAEAADLAARIRSVLDALDRGQGIPVVRQSPEPEQTALAGVEWDERNDR